MTLIMISIINKPSNILTMVNLRTNLESKKYIIDIFHNIFFNNKIKCEFLILFLNDKNDVNNDFNYK